MVTIIEPLTLFDPATPAIDWDTMDVVICCISGGKDSIASVFAVLDEGCPREKIVLVHQRVDGDPTDNRANAPNALLFDWPITDRYVKEFAAHMGIPLYTQWREGGISRELFRENDIPAPVRFQHDIRQKMLPTVGATPNTRRRFPAQSASLMTRWCSASAKIDPLARAITHEPAWQGTPGRKKRVALITGERAEESAARAKYAPLQPHKTSTKTREVLQYRPVLSWPERRIWATLRDHHIRPHPAYTAGFPRCSCAICVFLTDTLWARLRHINPIVFEAAAAVAEETLGWTIGRSGSLRERVATMPPITLTPEQTEAAHWALYPDTFPGIVWTWPDGWFPSGGFSGNAGGSP